MATAMIYAECLQEMTSAEQKQVSLPMANENNAITYLCLQHHIISLKTQMILSYSDHVQAANFVPSPKTLI